MDSVWTLLFLPSNDPLQRRIGVMGGLMGGTTLALFLTGGALEILGRWPGASLPAVMVDVAAGLLGGIALSGMALLPFVLGGHASRKMGRPRLLFSACLFLFFVGFAVRAFLFFDTVQAQLQDQANVGTAVAVLVGEPLASTSVIALLWGACRIQR